MTQPSGHAWGRLPEKRRGMAGLTVVPVVVLDVSDQQVEVLRTQENLRRRGLKPSETARAIRRLYELHGISENKGGRPTKETPAESAGVSPKTQEDVARDAGVSPRKAQRLNRIADLIGPLMRLLDHGDGTLHLVATPSNLLAHSVPRRARRRQQRKVWQYCQTFLCWRRRARRGTEWANRLDGVATRWSVPSPWSSRRISGPMRSAIRLSRCAFLGLTPASRATSSWVFGETPADSAGVSFVGRPPLFSEMPCSS